MILRLEHVIDMNGKYVCDEMIKKQRTTALTQTPCDVDLLEFVESGQYTSTSNTTENVGASSLHEGHEALSLNDLDGTINGSVVFDGLARGHHHTSPDRVDGVGYQTSADCHNVSKSEGGHESSIISENHGLECVVEAEVATSVN